MGALPAQRLTWSAALRLGRVSNLPTVWSNVMVGVMLAGGTAAEWRVAVLLVALSLFYLAGMYLNDAFDVDFDRQYRPERPIPSGEAGASTVLVLGLGMLVLGLALLAWIGFAGETGWRPAAAGAALGLVILYYDWHHKANPIGPFWMGLCRMLVYVTAACAVSRAPDGTVFLAASMLLSYLIGLTYIAKQETLGRVRNLWPLLFLGLSIAYGASLASAGISSAILFVAFAGWVLFALCFLIRRRPGDVPRAVVSLIAGISLFDALVVAGEGATAVALFAVLCFALTLALQRFVPGT